MSEVFFGWDGFLTSMDSLMGILTDLGNTISQLLFVICALMAVRKHRVIHRSSCLDLQLCALHKSNLHRLYVR